RGSRARLLNRAFHNLIAPFRWFFLGGFQVLEKVLFRDLLWRIPLRLNGRRSAFRRHQIRRGDSDEIPISDDRNSCHLFPGRGTERVSLAWNALGRTTLPYCIPG